MVDPSENSVDETPEGSPGDAIDRAHESSDIGDRLAATLSGRYRIDRLLGEGGMATVYLAKDLRHERQVALKVMRPELAAVVGGKRFLSEIKTTANLQHPNILPLYDSGEADGLLYYVMPYVEDESLRERLDREGQLSIEDATKIVTEVAEALQAAHDHGVIHRDIKPANILLSGGKPLVSDFGIAVAMTAAGGTRLTDTGLSVGTPSYMSPEQAAGDRAVGPASDIYSLACVLYETLVGDPPHVGSSAQAILGKIISSQPPSAIAQRPSIPDHIEAALRKGLEKLPADRFRSAADFAEALADESFRHGRPAGVSSASRWNVQTLLGWGTAAALAIALGWSLVGRQDNRAGTEVSRGVEWFALVPHESQPAGLRHFSIAPDGQAMVYLGRPQNGAESRLWIRRWEDLTPQPIPGTEGALNPTFSPNGDEIAFRMLRFGTVKIVALRGQAVRTVADSATCCLHWASDGALYFTRAPTRTVFRIPQGGGAVEQVTGREDPDLNSHNNFRARPDLDLGVFQANYIGRPAQIVAMRLSTGEQSVVAAGMKPFLTPGGDLVFASEEGRILAAPFNADAMKLTDEPVPLVDGLSVGGGIFPLYELSESGTLIYVRGLGGGQQMEWVSRSGASTPIDPEWVGSFWEVALSPDGSRVAFASRPRGARSDIWIKHLDRGPLIRVTRSGQDNGARNMGPAWTPDGSSILFASDFDVYRKRADGIGEAELVLDLPEHTVWDAWVMDGGRQLLHTRNYITCPVPALVAAGCDAGIYLRSLEGDSVILSIDNPGVHDLSPALSPDGNWMAYTSEVSGILEIYVRPFPNVDDGRWLVSKGGGTEPVWAHSGKELFYRNRWLELVAVDVSLGTEFTMRASHVLFSSFDYQSDWRDPQYAVAPGDDRFLMIRRIAGSDRSQLIVVQNWLEGVVNPLWPD